MPPGLASSGEPVLPGAQLGEGFQPVAGWAAQAPADAFAHARRIHAQEGIAGAFAGQGHRQAGFAAGALPAHFVQALVAVGVDGFGFPGKTPVGFGVFVGAQDPGVAGQGGQAVERGQHLRRAAFEQAAAAEAEEGVAAKQQAGAVEGDVAACMARYGDDLEAGAEGRHLHPVAVTDAYGRRRDTRVVRTVAGYGEGIEQRFDAADVVGMVVGQQHGHRPQAARGGFEHRRGIARIDHDAVAARPGQQPDVVVPERRQRDDFQGGGRIFRDFGQAG